LVALHCSFEIPVVVSLTLSGSLGSTIIEEKKVKFEMLLASKD